MDKISPTLAQARANFERVIHTFRPQYGQTKEEVLAKMEKAEMKRQRRRLRNVRNWFTQQKNYYNAK